MTDWHSLRVTRVVEETPVDRSLVLAVPPELRGTFRWRAGQHLVLRRTVDGEEYRRCYSISATPGEALRITVRRVRDGRVSGDLHGRVAEGSVLEVSAPCGAFCLDTAPRAHRTHYFYAAGSGITPILSMVGAVLAHEPHSVANLLFGNRNLEQIPFRESLDSFAVAYPGRFRLTHTLTSPPWWKAFDGWRGRIDGGAVHRFVDQHPPVAQDTHHWVCGPGGMNATVRRALRAIDVPDERIHAESFGSPGAVEDRAIEGVPATLEVTFADGAEARVPVAAGETLLDALRRAELPAPHACTAGVCSACRAQLTEGSVHQRSAFTLSEGEVERGVVLTCQAVPTGGAVGLRYP